MDFTTDCCMDNETAILIILFNLIFLTALLHSAPGPQDIYMYDFGPKGSDVWHGFTCVSEWDRYYPEKGYGWSDEMGVLTKGEQNPKPDPIASDFVRSPI